MEKISEKTCFPAFAIDGILGLFLFQLILNWVIDFQKFYVRLLPFLQTQIEISGNSKIHDEKQSSTEKRSENSSFNDKIGREDIEVVMEKLGLSSYAEGSGEKLEGFLGATEISQMFEEKEPSLEELKAAFDVFDENRDGFIDPNELKKVLVNLGFMEGLKVEDCERMISSSDENGDGRIEFNEFVKFMEISFS